MEFEMGRVESAEAIRRLKFPPDLESSFQESYFARSRTTIRASIFFTSGLSVLAALLHGINNGVFVTTHSKLFFLICAAILNLSLVMLSFRRDFSHYWQSFVVGTTLVSLAVLIINSPESFTPFVACYFFFIFCRLQRLHLRWMAAQLCGILLIGAIAFIVDSAKSGIWSWEDMFGTAFSASIFMCFPLWFAFRGERFERTEFWTKYLLAQDRNAERLKRKETEQMLHVLSQAIGGIVHDLGNPLTTVQIGAETLQEFAQTGTLDNATALEFTEMINDSAQMLNFLRLSLMEQTRVLEGKPIPVELALVPVRELIEAGIHYQKPRFAAGRNINMEGEDMEIWVDKMRFITIFMNLIGNALKYSDGEIRVTWRTYKDSILIAVQDQGNKGVGIKQNQAENLFVAFGRLDSHSEIEGTGLGLLSVSKIAEAHKGEVYIEGCKDGTTKSQSFSTAQGDYPSMLTEGFRTAFITTCPLQVSAPKARLASLPRQH